MAGGRCSRGFPRGAGAFLPWQWISWRSKFPSLTSTKINPNMLISVISLQIFSKFINETSGYHQYIINKSWISWVLDVGNIHEIHHLMFFRMTCDAGGLRETFRGMMAASSRPWFDKAMTLAAAPMPPPRSTNASPPEDPRMLMQHQALRSQVDGMAM